jgi:hypothetical protein
VKPGQRFPVAVREIPRYRFEAVSTGEFRPPKAGEWFLSGAIVEAFQAYDDMTTSYHIATIQETKP